MIKKSSQSDIGILGAGIMGCCLALELAQRGFRVDLIDGADTCMTSASLHNEGKLHLGFVYAKDPSKMTHSLMLRGSLAFSRIIEKLTGCGADSLFPSRPFHYFVPNDSQLSMNAINDHFHEVEQIFHEITRDTRDLYLDQRIDHLFTCNSPRQHKVLFSPDLTLGSFKTEERSISTVALAKILRQAIKRQSRINFIGNTEILTAKRLSGGDVEIETSSDGIPSLYRYHCVANCLWDDRLRIDSTAGINDSDPWILRYKATITVTTPQTWRNNIPSATGILGSYGDVVNHQNNAFYLSWYPLCKVVQSLDIKGRVLHDRVHKGILPRAIRKMTKNFPPIAKFVASMAHRGFIKDNIREMAAYIPSLDNLLINSVMNKLGGGVIMARGFTDIGDPTSILHQRSAIGPKAYESYITVDTGKYCMAPLFALETADMITHIMK